jgi:hypothetical protein
MRLVLLLFAVAVLHAGEPRLVLTAQPATATVGQPVTIIVAVANAPAFTTWGATVEVPSGLAITAQTAGATPVYVPDSRTGFAGAVRFGGHAPAPGFAAKTPGTHELARITVTAGAAGTYQIQAPSFSPGKPWGGILLPAGSPGQTVPLAASASLTVTGGGSANAAPTITVTGPGAALVLP